MKKKYDEDISDKRPRSNKKESKVTLFRYNNYTLLNTTCTNIFIEIRDRNIVNWPGKLREKLDLRDKKNYCHFHRDHGHDTEKCIMLKDEIETLIRRGYLSKCKREY